MDRYNFELYHFKVGAFFLRHSILSLRREINVHCIWLRTSLP